MENTAQTYLPESRPHGLTGTRLIYIASQNFGASISACFADTPDNMVIATSAEEAVGKLVSRTSSDQKFKLPLQSSVEEFGSRLLQSAGQPGSIYRIELLNQSEIV